MQTAQLQNKLMIIILDGFGSARKTPGNAIVQANPQYLSKIWNTFPHTYLKASSLDVGLPLNTNGNSEVGHLNLGAGRVIYQNLPKINRYIENGNFFSNQTLRDALQHAKENKSNIHILGCLSDGAVHSHIDHFIATLQFISQSNFVGNVCFDIFTDGRDTPPKSAETYINKLQQSIDTYKIGILNSITGRMYAMDRNQIWSRTEDTYNLLVNGYGQSAIDWREAIQKEYENGRNDEFFLPTKMKNKYGHIPISDNDVILYLNYRSDRAIQLTEAFTKENFNKFKTKPLQNIYFASMTEYSKNFPEHVIYAKEYIKLPLGRVVSEYGARQLRIAESEKFPHVTYFFNGGSSIVYDLEDRIEIPSPSVPTYDLKPEMSAFEMTQALMDRITNDYYKFIVVNFANGDMVGHTGNIDAAVKSIKVIDFAVEKLVRAFTGRGGSVIITADHGNVEEMINLKTGDIDTEHSQNAVPFILVSDKIKTPRLRLGALSDVAPTALELMGMTQPSEMTGKSLLY